MTKQLQSELVSLQDGSGRHPLRPLLRWAGGKQSLSTTLASFVPTDLTGRVYREPFFGAGALFFYLRPNRAVLSDLNADLIHAYRSIRAKPRLLARYLSAHALRDSKDYYYAVRNRYNTSRHFSVAQAARFLYLNRTCFNGIFRVNLQGAFNVPYGQKARPLFPATTHLLAASAALRRGKLRAEPFEAALRHARSGDFVYLDPPYPPLNGTSYFAHYTADRFHRKDQDRLAGVVRELDETGCLLLMSNANTQWIRVLYRMFNQKPVTVPRYVTTSERKHRVSELLITNYDLPSS